MNIPVATAAALLLVSVKLRLICFKPISFANVAALPFSSTFGPPYFLLITMSFGLIPLEKPVPKTFDTASFATKFLAKNGACASGLFFKKTLFQIGHKFY